MVAMHACHASMTPVYMPYMHDLACVLLPSTCRFPVDPRTECRILHGPWRHSGQSMNDAPILQKSWHENETDPSPAWLFKLRGGWWICASRIVEDGGSWDGCEVYASIEGDNLPQGKVYVPWDDRQGILPCWSQGACAAVLEVFQEFGKVAWRNESSYLQQIQSLEKQVLDGQKEKDQLLEEKVQQELVIHMLALEAAELHALSTCTNACMHGCMCLFASYHAGTRTPRQACQGAGFA